MNVTFETVICAWDEKIPALLIRLVNTLLFCRTEEELRQSIDKYGAQNETYIEGWEKKTSKLLIYKRLCKI